MRPKSLLVLAVVVGALLALIYFAEDKVASTDERVAAAKRLVDAKPEELVALEFEWQGNRVRFERAAAAREPGIQRPWRLVAPIAQPADDAAVGRLVTALTDSSGAGSCRRGARRRRARATARHGDLEDGGRRGSPRDRRRGRRRPATSSWRRAAGGRSR